MGCSGLAKLHRCWCQLELELELFRSHLVGCQGLAKLHGGAWREIETLKSALIIPHWVSDPPWRISKLLMSVRPSVHQCMCTKRYLKDGWKDVFTECTYKFPFFLPNYGQKSSEKWAIFHWLNRHSSETTKKNTNNSTPPENLRITRFSSKYAFTSDIQSTWHNNKTIKTSSMKTMKIISKQWNAWFHQLNWHRKHRICHKFGIDMININVFTAILKFLGNGGLSLPCLCMLNIRPLNSCKFSFFTLCLLVKFVRFKIKMSHHRSR